MSITVTRKVHFSTGLAGQKLLRKGTATKMAATRVPRISRLMALAIHFDQLIREGKVRDYAELAARGQVCRTRVTQIMNLLLLAPDIQHQILCLPPIETGPDRLLLRTLQAIAKRPDWTEQRAIWNHIVLLGQNFN
jgi:hypothetical protein